jgi:hypothetical protein
LEVSRGGTSSIARSIGTGDKVMAYGLLLSVLAFFLGAWIAGLGCGA